MVGVKTVDMDDCLKRMNGENAEPLVRAANKRSTLIIKTLKLMALGGAALAATSLPGVAQQQEAGHGGCYVTLSPTDATRGIRYWRPPSSCADWAKHIDKLRPTETASTGAPWVRVVVWKVDLPATRITVAHGAIPRIRMPAMTIQNIPVTDAASLALLRAGDKIEIQCDHSGGGVRIVNIRI
jgi:Cu/Ag efflux protein CusF